MKLGIAAGILLPVLSPTVRSEEDVHTKRFVATKARHPNDPPFDVSHFLATVVKHRPVTSPPRSHPQRVDSRQRHRERGLLKNNHNSKKKCDPSSNDPDIGILSCDIGYECLMVDQHESTLGGVCTLSTTTATTTTTTTTRDLQDEELVTCSLCNRGAKVTSEDYATVLNAPNEEGNGETCGEVAYALYYNTTVGIPYSACLFVAELAQESGCCSPVPVTTTYNCNICGDVGLFYPESVFPLIDGSIIPCADIPLDLNDTECELYSPYYATQCCAPEFDASRVPTATPQEGSDDANPNNPPSAGAVADAAARSTLVFGSFMTITPIAMLMMTMMAR